MPIYRKKSHGKVHLYGGIGKSQQYIGPEDNPSKWDTKIVSNVLSTDKKNILDSLSRYIKEIDLLSNYDIKNRPEYISQVIQALTKTISHSLSDPELQKKYESDSKEYKKAEDQIRLRQELKKEIMEELNSNPEQFANNLLSYGIYGSSLTAQDVKDIVFGIKRKSKNP